MNRKSLDNVLSEVVKVFGPYTDQIVIGGGIALLIYSSRLNFPLGKFIWEIAV